MKPTIIHNLIFATVEDAETFVMAVYDRFPHLIGCSMLQWTRHGQTMVMGERTFTFLSAKCEDLLG
jgi:hypothetical protein